MLSLTLLAESLLRRGHLKIDEIAKTHGVSPTEVIGGLKKAAGIIVDEEKVVVVDKLAFVASLLRRGVDPLVVSKHLSWRDFEREVADILDSFGYHVLRGYRIKKPVRGEIDVVAVSTGCVGFAIDCKHWSFKASSPSRLFDAARRHMLRTRALAKDPGIHVFLRSKCPKGASMYPVLVTLHDKVKGAVEGVIIVPIQLFRSFLLELDMVSYDAEKVFIRPGGV